MREISVLLHHEEAERLFRRAVDANGKSWPLKASDPAVKQLRAALDAHERPWDCDDCGRLEIHWAERDCPSCREAA